MSQRSLEAVDGSTRARIHRERLPAVRHSNSAAAVGGADHEQGGLLGTGGTSSLPQSSHRAEAFDDMVGHGKRVDSGSSTASPPSSPSLQHMYFLEGGLLVANNLLRTDAWVHDEERTHCNVCVQQFLPFRRRHHCRTCGEVVCGGCSSQRTIRLTDVNVECATRICTYCVIHATDASIRANETALRETCTLGHDSGRPIDESFFHPLPAPPAPAAHSFLDHHHHRHQPQYMMTPPSQSANHLSLFSIDSALTDGSVVQLWPQPERDGEAARLKVACHPAISSRENDSTMNLLVSIITRTLKCPVAFIGILDESNLWFKASVGWTRSELPRHDCVAAHTLAQAKTLVVDDTLNDKHFHASDLRIEGQPMRFYAGAPIWVLGECIGAVCAFDVKAHKSTSESMTATLESVAKIASEVLEQRVNQMTPRDDEQESLRDTLVPSSAFFSASLLAAMEEEGVESACSRPSVSQSVTSSHEHISVSSRGGFYSVEQDETGSFDKTPRTPHESRDSECQWLDVSASRRSYYTTLQPVPQEYGDKITLAMDLFHRLQSHFWSERPIDASTRGLFGKCMENGTSIRSNNRSSGKSSSSSSTTSGSASTFACSDGSTWKVKTFETLQHGRLFTRTNMKVAGACEDVVAQLLDYEDARIYQRLFSHVTRRYKLNDATWMDEVVFRPGIQSVQEEHLRVLSHWRQYPDGSNVIVAVNGSDLRAVDERDLLFGWLVAPCSLDDGSQSVNVSCIVAQPFENQSADLNLSMDLAMRVNRSAPSSFKLPPSASPSSRASRSARLSSDDPSVQLQTDSSMAIVPEDRLALPTSCSAVIVSLQQHARLNDKERLMLNLLDQTISTQEILAAQQSEMAGVIDLHGAQLRRISTAIERVETLLADKATRMRRGTPSVTSRHSFN